jgi:hypothetical protein
MAFSCTNFGPKVQSLLTLFVGNIKKHLATAGV